MVVSVASGKGGTGKTTVAVNLFLASAALKSGGVSHGGEREILDPGITFLDCDVEEPNAHIFLKPDIHEHVSVFTMVPRIIPERCSHCGTCARVCVFNAILSAKQTTVVLERLCHGCGACVLFCPRKAVVEDCREIGVIEIGSVGPGLVFGQGILRTEEVLTTRVIAELKRRVKRQGFTIIDAPPGASCPMVEAVKGSDFCILVAEPTPFGMHDLALAVEVVRKLGIAAGVVVNRSDSGDRSIFRFCDDHHLPVLLEIPFDRKLMEYYADGRACVCCSERYLDMFKLLFTRLNEEVRKQSGSMGKRPKNGVTIGRDP